MKKLLIAALLLVPFLVAPPAQASTNLGTVTFDCNAQTDVMVVGAPGDTVTLDSVNCQLIPVSARTYSPPVQLSDFSVSNGLFFLNPTTITLPSTFLSAFLVSWQYGGVSGPFYGIKLTLTSGGGSSGGSVESSAGPNPLGQGLPVPASGDCRDINDEDAGWATDLEGGWEIGWSTWRRDDGTIFHDGWVCKRTIEYKNDRWQVRQPDEFARFIRP